MDEEKRSVITELERFRGIMWRNGSGAVFLDHKGRGWYLGTKLDPADVLLIPFYRYSNWEGMVAAFFREFREHTTLDNIYKRRSTFMVEYINHVYEAFENLHARGVTPAGGNYDRHNEG